MPAELPDCSSSNQGGTTGTITFRTVVQDVFSDTYPSGDPSVDQGDVLDNSVDVIGTVLDNETLLPYAPLSFSEDDDSGATLAIPYGTIQKLSMQSTVSSVLGQAASIRCRLQPAILLPTELFIRCPRVI